MRSNLKRALNLVANNDYHISPTRNSIVSILSILELRQFRPCVHQTPIHIHIHIRATIKLQSVQRHVTWNAPRTAFFHRAPLFWHPSLPPLPLRRTNLAGPMAQANKYRASAWRFSYFLFFFFFNVQTRSSNRTSQCDIRNETNLLEQFSTLLSLRTINRSSRIVFLLDFFREREREGQYLSKTEEEEEEERSGEGKKVVEIS